MTADESKLTKSLRQLAHGELDHDIMKAVVIETSVNEAAASSKDNSAWHGAAMIGLMIQLNRWGRSST